jgi:4a-hydroxytetrahydrobiopterin dehydratase
MSLNQKTCVPCQGGVPPLSRVQAVVLGRETPDWSLNDEANRIERGFKFGGFQTALDFVNQVGDLAEIEGHHPDIMSDVRHRQVRANDGNRRSS